MSLSPPLRCILFATSCRVSQVPTMRTHQTPAISLYGSNNGVCEPNVFNAPWLIQHAFPRNAIIRQVLDYPESVQKDKLPVSVSNPSAGPSP